MVANLPNHTAKWGLPHTTTVTISHISIVITYMLFLLYMYTIIHECIQYTYIIKYYFIISHIFIALLLPLFFFFLLMARIFTVAWQHHQLLVDSSLWLAIVVPLGRSWHSLLLMLFCDWCVRVLFSTWLRSILIIFTGFVPTLKSTVLYI